MLRLPVPFLLLLVLSGCGPGGSGSDGGDVGQGPQPGGGPGGPDDGPGGGEPDGSPAPNVLLILADDLGVDMLGCYAEGGDLPATPNVDALASAGVLFRNAWSRPVCSPTRAGILTGRLPRRTGIGFVVSTTGVALAPSELTIPEVLDGGGSGYAHAVFGKWHLGNASNGGLMAPNVAGFAFSSGTPSSLFPPNEDYFQWTHVTNGSVVLESTYEPEVITDEAIAWMNAQAQPFFCYLSFNLPHDPYHRPPDYLHSIDFTGVDPDPKVEPRPYYKAMVEAMDTLVGRVTSQLDPSVLANTLILFTGDNGTPRGLQVPPFSLSRAKTTTYEGGVNVPLIASGAGVGQLGECAALVDSVDLFATVLEVAGVDPLAQVPGLELDSVSLAPYLLDPATPSLRATVVTELFLPNGEAPGPLDFLCEQPLRGPAGQPALLSGPLVVPCQADQGFGGPGTLELSICGMGTFLPATLQHLQLVGGPPGAAGFLFEGDGFAPLAVGAGTVVPAPGLHFLSHPITLDAQGAHERFVAHLGGSEVVFYQAIASDPALPGGWAVSNAVAAVQDAHSSAIRDQRYKLIRDAYTCREAFFDLELDPFEELDLLQVGLDPAQQAAYDELWAELELLVGS